jgi:hypothetical protein
MVAILEPQQNLVQHKKEEGIWRVAKSDRCVTRRVSRGKQRNSKLRSYYRQLTYKYEKEADLA